MNLNKFTENPMKNYSNSTRKPMMYGGMASPSMTSQQTQTRAQKPRTGMGGASTPPMTMSQGGATDDARRAQIKAQYEKGGKDREAVMAMAEGKGKDAMIARSVIREKGGAAGAAAMPMGDQQPAGKRYGGKVKKA
jgi:hypothetical protein